MKNALSNNKIKHMVPFLRKKTNVIFTKIEYKLGF